MTGAEALRGKKKVHILKSTIEELKDQSDAIDRETSSKSPADIQREEYENACRDRYRDYEEYGNRAFSNQAELKKLLTVLSNFKFSALNTLLVYGQKPDATDLRSRDQWDKEQYFLKKDAVAVFMNFPTEKYNSKGMCYSRSFTKRAVFDISDIANPKIKEKTREDDVTLVRALIHDCPVRVETVDDMPKEKGNAYYDPVSKAIFARGGMDTGEILSSVSKAVFHAMISKGKDDYKPEENTFAAECASFAIAKKYGIDTDLFKISKIPENIAKGDWKDKYQEFSKVRDNYMSLMRKMDDYIQTERMNRSYGGKSVEYEELEESYER